MQNDAPPLASDSPHQARLHAGRQAERRRLIAALTEHGNACRDPDDPDAVPPALTLTSKLRTCGRYPSVLWSDHAQRFVISRCLCKARLCPTCGAKRAQRLRSTLLPIVRELDSARMLTLTLRSTDDPLEDQVKRLTKAFGQLRRRKHARKYLTGGLYVIEITYNAAADRWHPHLHVIADGRYWPQAELAALWNEITGDSRIADIRACHDRRSAVNYVTSYVSKSQTPKDCPPHRLFEWCEALHGKPMARPFGKCHGAKLNPKPDDSAPELQQLMPLDPLLEAVERGDPDASDLYTRLMHATQPTAELSDDTDPAAEIEARYILHDELDRWWNAYRYRQTGDPRYAPPPEPSGLEPSPEPELMLYPDPLPE